MLALRAIGSLATLAGVQQRLANVGFPVRPTGELDEATRLALAAIQREARLPVTGVDDAATIDWLARGMDQEGAPPPRSS